jgi:hypothetical protein
MNFNPNSYGPIVADLYQADRRQPLGPGAANRQVQARLAAFTPESLFPGPINDLDMARLCLAGLWLFHDFLYQCHSIAQEVETPTGSYWHAVLHRREPDFGNSKYWWRRVGSHPLLDTLAEEAAVLLSTNAKTKNLARTPFDPNAFVDLCEAARPGTELERICLEVQHLEWQLLFDFCHRQAVN